MERTEVWRFYFCLFVCFLLSFFLFVLKKDIYSFLRTNEKSAID